MKYFKSAKNRTNLFVFPAQSNFDGRKYNLDLIEYAQSGKMTSDSNISNISGDWLVCLDASSYMSSSALSLSILKPDFVVMSFYKLFGFPSALGALLIRKTSKVSFRLTFKRFDKAYRTRVCWLIGSHTEKYLTL